jgi:hypothetical protein
MPVSPERMPLYPGGSIFSPEWLAIVVEIGVRSGWRCEGAPAYPGCRAGHGEPHPVTGSIVVLGVAHLDQDPSNNGEPGARPNLAHLCQRCHLAHDERHRAAAAASTRFRKLSAGTLPLPLT